MQTLTKTALQATLHRLTGCAVGEIIGTVVGSGLHWNNWATEFLTIPLAFLFGYAFTMWPLLRHMALHRSAGIALASDTLSITSMEITDNAIILLIPGALSAGPTSALFWASLVIALVVAFIVTMPVNRYLIAQGKGHAHVHEHMHPH